MVLEALCVLTFALAPTLKHLTLIPTEVVEKQWRYRTTAISTLIWPQIQETQAVHIPVLVKLFKCFYKHLLWMYSPRSDVFYRMHLPWNGVYLIICIESRI